MTKEQYKKYDKIQEELRPVKTSASMPYQVVTRWQSVNLVSTRRDL